VATGSYAVLGGVLTLIHLVALTGRGQDSDERRAREAGFDAHLVKAVPPDALDRVLATVADAVLASRGGATGTAGRR
jgi:CheY-like chemotaxis protein